MFTVFDFPKAIEASAVILRAHEKTPVSEIRLLKLLYLAERESWKTICWPILGHRVVAAVNGPHHAVIDQLLEGCHTLAREWQSHIVREQGFARLASNPGVNLLSCDEIRILSHVAQQYAFNDDWELVETTRGFSEWTKNHRPSRVLEIPYGDILAAVGYTAEQIQDIHEDIENARILEAASQRETSAKVDSNSTRPPQRLEIEATKE